jgi:SAM-dependent methyltransferase
LIRETAKAIARQIPAIDRLLKQRDALLNDVAALNEAASQRDLMIKQRDALLSEVAALRDAIKPMEELQVANQQYADALKHAGVPPIPPPHLQRRVVGVYSPGFHNAADHSIRDFDSALRSAEKRLSDFESVLDFGVGCGRVARRISELYPIKLIGADIDPEAIAWLQQNYAPRVGQFVLFPHMPPSDFKEEVFDLIYSISVFTHLNEKMQFSWLAELRRVVKRGGYLLLTVHGENHHQSAPPHVQRTIRENGFCYDEAAGITEGLPEFYKNTYHTRQYVEREWSRFFEILSYTPRGSENHQDLVLCRRH